MKEIVISMISNIIISSCIIYTFMSVPYIYLHSKKINSTIVKVTMGFLSGIISVYLNSLGDAQHSNLYSLIITPIVVSFIIYGYSALFIGIIVSTALVFGNSIFYDTFAFAFFLSIITFRICKMNGLIYVIVSYCIAQGLNLIINNKAITIVGYWNLAIIKSVLSLVVLTVLYIAYNNLITFASKINRFKYASETDILTGIDNRRSIDVILDSIKTESNFCIAMIDIDDFKSVNDNYGHLFGDEVISNTAHLMKSNIRNTDFVGRYGGEEFIIILKSNISEAILIMDKIRLLIKKSSNNTPQKEIVKVTVSIGLAEHFDNKSIKQTIENADKALYKAKHGGKNKVIVYS